MSGNRKTIPDRQICGLKTGTCEGNPAGSGSSNSSVICTLSCFTVLLSPQSEEVFHAGTF